MYGNGQVEKKLPFGESQLPNTIRDHLGINIHTPKLEDKRTPLHTQNTKQRGQTVLFFPNMRIYFLWQTHTTPLLFYAAHKIR